MTTSSAYASDPWNPQQQGRRPISRESYQEPRSQSRLQAQNERGMVDSNYSYQPRPPPADASQARSSRFRNSYIQQNESNPLLGIGENMVSSQNNRYGNRQTNRDEPHQRGYNSVTARKNKELTPKISQRLQFEDKGNGNYSASRNPPNFPEQDYRGSTQRHQQNDYEDDRVHQPDSRQISQRSYDDRNDYRQLQRRPDDDRYAQDQRYEPPQQKSNDRNFENDYARQQNKPRGRTIQDEYRGIARQEDYSQQYDRVAPAAYFPGTVKTSTSTNDYRQQLEEQIRQKKEAQARENINARREEQREILDYNPYGKEGAGAPRKLSSLSNEQYNSAEALSSRPMEMQSEMPTLPMINQKSFVRGVGTLDKLPDWQKEEVLKKHLKYQENQQNLKNQMAAAAEEKHRQIEKQKALDREEEERIDMERKQLEIAYQQEESRRAASKESDKIKTSSSQNAPITKDAAREKAKEEARELFLKAQQEAEELRKNKFKAKREIAQSTKPVKVESRRQSISPPLPAQVSDPIDFAAFSATDVPPNSVSLPKISSAAPAPQPRLRSSDVSARQNTSMPMYDSRNTAAASIDPIAAFQLDLKTRAVLDQLSAIKQELDRERDQIRHELDRQRILTLEAQARQAAAYGQGLSQWQQYPVYQNFQQPMMRPQFGVNQVRPDQQFNARPMQQPQRPLVRSNFPPSNEFLPKGVVPQHVAPTLNHGHEVGEQVLLHSTSKHMPIVSSAESIANHGSKATMPDRVKFAAPVSKKDDDTLSVLFGPADLSRRKPTATTSDIDLRTLANIPPPITGFKGTNSVADLATLNRVNQARKDRLTQLGVTSAAK